MRPHQAVLFLHEIFHFFISSVEFQRFQELNCVKIHENLYVAKLQVFKPTKFILILAKILQFHCGKP